MTLVARLIDFIRHKACSHQFVLDDLEKTNYPELERPADNASLEEWYEYHTGIYTHEFHTKRVRWPCAKCGKVFYAHCGLDISTKHGPIVKRQELA